MPTINTTCKRCKGTGEAEGVHQLSCARCGGSGVDPDHEKPSPEPLSPGDSVRWNGAPATVQETNVHYGINSAPNRDGVRISLDQGPAAEGRTTVKRSDVERVT